MKPSSQLFIIPPRWHRSRYRGVTHIPLSISHWIFEQGSLTRRLQERYGESFRVNLLSQSWERPFAEEARQLKLGPGRQAIVREVALEANDQPLIYARSVIPARTLQGADRRLAHLGNRPLGHILFSDPRLHRIELELARTGPASWQPGLLPITDSGAAACWGRRSLYSLGGRHTLLVAEFFLPALFNT